MRAELRTPLTSLVSIRWTAGARDGTAVSIAIPSAAFRRWRCQPGVKDGAPVPVMSLVPAKVVSRSEAAAVVIRLPSGVASCCPPAEGTPARRYWLGP
jgi:hypothetical protein